MDDININLAAGSSIRLPTSGKYCDRDIVITTSSGSSIRLPTSGKYCNKDIVIKDTDGNITVTPFDKGGDSGGTAPVVKQFTLADFGDQYISARYGNNTFDFDEGMTWAEWKASAHNAVENGFEKFESVHNAAGVMIDVACCPDTPVSGITHADGTPVKDSEVIEATTYYYVYDLDFYGQEDSGDGGDGGECSATVTSTDEENYGSITIIFTDGMTWREWMESEDGQSHNAYGAEIGEIKFDIGGTTHEITEESLDDTITNGATYTAQPY